MGLVNAFINQIGREVARDVYRHAKSRPTKNISASTMGNTFNEAIINEVKTFQLEANEKENIRELVNLVENSENIDASDFDWADVFVELDNKIDFCKENVETTHLEKLEALDQQNAANFSIAKTQHILYIQKTIEGHEQQLAKQNPLYHIFGALLSILGLGSFYYVTSTVKKCTHILLNILTFSFVYLGYQTYIDPIGNHGNLLIDTAEAIQKVRNTGMILIVIGTFTYVLMLQSSLRDLFSLNRSNKATSSRIGLLNDYLKHFE